VADINRYEYLIETKENIKKFVEFIRNLGGFKEVDSTKYA
jgi:hypothetical protein